MEKLMKALGIYFISGFSGLARVVRVIAAIASIFDGLITLVTLGYIGTNWEMRLFGYASKLDIQKRIKQRQKLSKKENSLD